MPLELHPKAELSFNAAAQSLVSRLHITESKPMFRVPPVTLVDNDGETASDNLKPEVTTESEVVQDLGATKAGFPSQRPVVAHFTSKDIIGGVGAIRLHQQDKRGRVLSLAFQQGNDVIGLEGEDFREFHRLVERIQRVPSWREAVSVQAVREEGFNWLRHRYLEQLGTEESSEEPDSFCTALQKHFASKISPQEVWVPLAGIESEKDFSFGRVELKTITPDMVERYRQDLESWAIKHPERGEGWQWRFVRDQRRWQGATAVCFRCIAEREYAVEMAYLEAERTVALLRFFSPSALFPDALTRLAMAGWDENIGREHFLVKDGVMDHFGSGGRHPLLEETNWRLSEDELGNQRILGWNEVDRLLREESLTEFERIVMEALRVYSRSAAAPGLSDKLLYILAGLEILLVDSDASLPTNLVQQVVGEGVALLNVRELEERKNILQDVKSAYKLRQALLRRDETAEEVDSLREFFFQSHPFFVYTLNNFHHRTKKQFLDALETRKLRGGLQPCETDEIGVETNVTESNETE